MIIYDFVAAAKRPVLSELDEEEEVPITTTVTHLENGTSSNGVEEINRDDVEEDISNDVEDTILNDVGLVRSLPIVLQQLKGQIVEVGSDVSFTCEFKNFEALGWSVNGKAIAPSDRITMSADGGIVHLCVKEVTVDDSGDYICYAINGDGKAYTVTNLSVRGESQRFSIWPVIN